MKDLTKGPEVIVNVPTRLRYYLDPVSILVGAAIVSIAIIYSMSLLK
jgi:hypothetical protein